MAITFEEAHKALELTPPTKKIYIKAAYFEQAKLHHPDVCKSPTALEEMQKINEAREYLNGLFDKNIYDAEYEHYKTASPKETITPEPPPRSRSFEKVDEEQIRKDVLSAYFENDTKNIPDYLNPNKFTWPQLSAILSQAKALSIIACAGSGKTKTITNKIVHILKQGSLAQNNLAKNKLVNKEIKPNNIVAITYTEKAAAELKDRIYSIGSDVLGNTNGFHEMYIGTIHGFCLDNLKEYYFGYKDFINIEGDALFELVHKNAIKLNMHENLKWSHGLVGDFIEVVEWFDEQDPKIYKSFTAAKEMTNAYHAFLEENKCFTFSTMLWTFVNKLKTDPGFLKHIAQKYTNVFIDEYQDVNYIQSEIAKIFYSAGISICVVGDDDQCIYQFRGSSSSYLLNFSNDFPGATEVFLNRNFRSTNKIIKYAENFIFELNGGTSEGRRKDKEFLFDEKKKSTNSNDITYTMYANNEDEASAIVKNIVQLHDKAGLAYKDIAILCRKKKQFKMISKALAYGKIPHIVKDLGDLFECEVGSGFLSLFGFIDNPSLNDRNELEKALKLINPAVSAEAIIKCFEYVESIKKGLSNFTDSEISIQRIFKTILELIEINQLDTSSKLTEVIFYELGSVSTLIDEFEKVHYLDLPNMKINKFYTLITGSLEDGGSSIEKYQKGGANKYIDIDAVNIMTVHSSKGLEYAAVFMPGLNVGTFPNNMNRHFMMGRRKVAVWDSIGKTLPKTMEVQHEENNLSYEANLFYVGITRAKKYLILSRFITSWSKTGRISTHKTSPFVYKSLALPDEPVKLMEENEKITFERVPEWALKKDTKVFSLNYTIIEHIEKCPFLAKLVEIYGFKDLVTSRTGYGEQVHLCVEKIIKWLQTENDISKLESYISKAIDELSLRYATTEDLKIIKATVNKSLHGDKINEIFKQYKNLESEHNFEFLCLADSSDRVMINGRIDLVINDKEKGITIVDFKTSSIDPDARLETLQLPIYTKGYSEVNPQIPSEGFILNVDTNVQSKTKKLSLDEYNKIVPVIAESIKYIKEDSFPCTAGDKCEKCKFKTICHCYFKK